MAVAERGATTRARLIAATIEVVREVGYAHATTRAIAQRAGVAEGTIYRHFPDKAALLFSAILERDATVREALATLPSQVGTATVATNLTEVLVRLASLRSELLPLELALLTDPELASRRRQAAATLRTGRLVGPPQVIAGYLAHEQHLGRVRADVAPERMAVVLLAMLFGFALMAADDSDALPGEELADAVSLVLTGLQPRDR